MTTLESIKARFLTDGQMNWSFVPEPKADPRGCLLHPNLERVRVTADAIVDALYMAEEKELSENVLRDTLHYLVGKSEWFHRDSYRGTEAWRTYSRQYGLSPCCCCSWQSSVSWRAATLGYEDLRRYAVKLPCPASPPEYRPEMGKGEPVESWLNVHRRAFIEEHLQALLKGEVDFFSR
jgi:hypothetical protein